MSSIKLVQGDNRPFINLTLTNSVTGTPIDLSDPTTTVVVYFRKAGSTTILQTFTCGKIDNGVNGVVNFNFPNNALNVDPGAYEGEIEVSFNGQKQTIYQPLKFVVRQQFA